MFQRLDHDTNRVTFQHIKWVTESSFTL